MITFFGDFPNRGQGHMTGPAPLTVARGGLRTTADPPGFSGTTAPDRRRLHAMCRNITTLRGLKPEATVEEIEAAARQYVRKVSGVQTTSTRTEDAFEKAARKVANATAELLADLPPRHQPPTTLPPLRRLKIPAG